MEKMSFYKPVDLAQLLNVNIMTIYRYIKAGRLKAYKLWKEYRIENEDFQNFLKNVKS